MRARKRLLDKRRPIIQRADELYRLKEDYFALDDSDAKRKTVARITEMLAAPLARQPSANIVPTVDDAPSPSRFVSYNFLYVKNSGSDVYFWERRPEKLYHTAHQ